MLRNISNLGSTLTKKEQMLVQGGASPCPICFDYCRSQNFETKEEFSACFYDCKQEGLC